MEKYIIQKTSAGTEQEDVTELNTETELKTNTLKAMHDLFILMLGGAFTAKIVTRLEKEKKESISKEEILDYIARASIETIESINESEKTENLRKPSQN